MNPKESTWIATKKFFSEALLVALLTAVAYLAAFAYQYSYLSYFNIPSFFVDINLGLVLLTASFGLVWLLGMTFLFGTLMGWKPVGILAKILRQIVAFLTLVIGLFFPLIILIYDPHRIWLTLILFLIIFIGAIVGGIRLYRDPTLFDKVDTKKNENHLLTKVERIYGSFPVLFVLILILFVGYSLIMGKAISQTQTEYLVSDTNPNLIIVSTYQDSFVGLTFSTTTQKFNKQITLLSKDKISQDGIIFTYEKIGPLTSN